VFRKWDPLIRTKVWDEFAEEVCNKYIFSVFAILQSEILFCSRLFRLGKNGGIDDHCGMFGPGYS
jgi:hypothetical protein